MPMRNESDFGGGNTSSRYCAYCTDEQGTLKPYEVALEGMKQFIISTGVSEEEALKTAKENMAKMPAWQGKVT